MVKGLEKNTDFQKEIQQYFETIKQHQDTLEEYCFELDLLV
jgi:hypothetical protein